MNLYKIFENYTVWGKEFKKVKENKQLTNMQRKQIKRHKLFIDYCIKIKNKEIKENDELLNAIIFIITNQYSYISKDLESCIILEKIYKSPEYNHKKTNEILHYFRFNDERINLDNFNNYYQNGTPNYEIHFDLYDKLNIDLKLTKRQKEIIKHIEENDAYYFYYVIKNLKELSKQYKIDDILEGCDKINKDLTNWKKRSIDINTIVSIVINKPDYFDINSTFNDIINTKTIILKQKGKNNNSLKIKYENFEDLDIIFKTMI